jgi:hypothetical protein
MGRSASEKFREGGRFQEHASEPRREGHQSTEVNQIFVFKPTLYI